LTKLEELGPKRYFNLFNKFGKDKYFVYQISGNLKYIGRLSTKSVEYWILKEYQQNQLSTKLVTSIIGHNIWRISQNIKL